MKPLRTLHDDELGLTTLQVVAIVAVAAIILAFVRLYWHEMKNWVATAVAEIFSLGQ